MQNYASSIINTTGTMACKTLFAFIGTLVAYIEPTFPFIIVCTLAVLADCITAWSLSRRVKKKLGKSDGFFRSDHFGRVFVTLIKIYCVIILAFLIDTVIIDGKLALANIAAGAICFWQMWSILENESSCNDATWAKIAQRIMVDKTERHFNVDLHELKHEEDTKQ